jgi:hypothetical protein
MSAQGVPRGQQKKKKKKKKKKRRKSKRKEKKGQVSEGQRPQHQPIPASVAHQADPASGNI